jgi:hypothetical protein
MPTLEAGRFPRVGGRELHFLLPSRQVNTAYRKTSLHRDKPNLERAVSALRSKQHQCLMPGLRQTLAA